MTLGAGSTGAQARQCLCALRYVAARVSVRSNVDYKRVFIYRLANPRRGRFCVLDAGEKSAKRLASRSPTRHQRSQDLDEGKDASGNYSMLVPIVRRLRYELRVGVIR